MKRNFIWCVIRYHRTRHNVMAWDEVYRLECQRCWDRWIGWFQTERIERQETSPRLNGARKGTNEKPGGRDEEKTSRRTEEDESCGTIAEYHSKYRTTLIFCFISNRRDRVKKFSPAEHKCRSFSILSENAVSLCQVTCLVLASVSSTTENRGRRGQWGN